MILGYARVSTKGQDIAPQVEALKAAGCAKIFKEKASGTNADRPQLCAALKALSAGDTLIVTAVDRLARDTRDLLNILHELRTAGAGFRSLAEPLVDTTSEMAEVIIAVLGIAAKWERGRIAERTAEGRRQAQERGVKFGRRPKLTPHQKKQVLKRIYSGDTQRTIALDLNVSQATISRLVQEDIREAPSTTRKAKNPAKRRKAQTHREDEWETGSWAVEAGLAGGLAGMLGVGGGYAVQKGTGEGAHYFRRRHPTGTEWHDNIHLAHRFTNPAVALDALVVLQNTFEHEADRNDEFSVVPAP